MNSEALVLIVLAACVVYWYVRRARSDRSSSPPPPVPQPIPPSLAQTFGETDPFLRQVASEKVRTDAAVTAALQLHERELEKRFADDVKLKERLSQFARVNELDKALIALWEEIKHYPAWSSRDDFDKWNKLHLTDIAGSSEKDTESVEFMHGTQRFNVTERSWSGMEGDSYADFSFFEDGDEVFAIGCSIDYGEYGTSYRCLGISAFKKRGNWAKVLLEYYGRIQVERSKSSAELKYFRADEIKSRFEE